MTASLLCSSITSINRASHSSKQIRGRKRKAKWILFFFIVTKMPFTFNQSTPRATTNPFSFIALVSTTKEGVSSYVLLVFCDVGYSLPWRTSSEEEEEWTLHGKWLLLRSRKRLELRSQI